MGFLDHTTNNIIVDAVLTDLGRQKLANSASDGGLNIVKYSFADNEVDYTLLKKYGETVGKEKIEKNTPIFEANTDSTAEYNLLYDFVTGAVPSINTGSLSGTAAFVRGSTTEGLSSTSPQDFTAYFQLTGFTGASTVQLKIYFNSNAVTAANGTEYSSGIGSGSHIRYCTSSVNITSGAADFSFVFNKVADSTFSGERMAHIVLEADGYGTMGSMQVSVQFT